MRFLFFLAIAFGLAVSTGVSRAEEDPLANTVIMTLKYGKVRIELFPDVAPKHVERFKKLVSEEFYNGLKFHRVMDGFMAQTGDPTGTGSGGSSYPDLKAEFSSQPFGRGTLGAARTSDPHSANSQFFICFEAAPWLNDNYTVFGKVVRGMEFVDLLKRGAEGSGIVTDPDVIVDIKMAKK